MKNLLFSLVIALNIFPSIVFAAPCQFNITSTPSAPAWYIPETWKIVNAPSDAQYFFVNAPIAANANIKSITQWGNVELKNVVIQKENVSLQLVKKNNDISGTLGINLNNAFSSNPLLSSNQCIALSDTLHLTIQLPSSELELKYGNSPDAIDHILPKEGITLSSQKNAYLYLKTPQASADYYYSFYDENHHLPNYMENIGSNIYKINLIDAIFSQENNDLIIPLHALVLPKTLANLTIQEILPANFSDKETHTLTLNNAVEDKPVTADFSEKQMAHMAQLYKGINYFSEINPTLKRLMSNDFNKVCMPSLLFNGKEDAPLILNEGENTLIIDYRQHCTDIKYSAINFKVDGDTGNSNFKLIFIPMDKSILPIRHATCHNGLCQIDESQVNQLPFIQSAENRYEVIVSAVENNQQIEVGTFSVDASQGDVNLPLHVLTSQLATTAIRGFDPKLVMGTIVEPGVPKPTPAWKTVDEVFIYGGEGGIIHGDSSSYPDLHTTQGLRLARQMEQYSQHAIMPTFVYYTWQLSGGWSTVDLTTYLTDNLTNLVLDVAYLESQKDKDHPYPASVILNPDTLGMLLQSPNVYDAQKGIFNFGTGQSVAGGNDFIAVNDAIKKVFARLQVSVTPPQFADDFQGWVEANNYLMRLFAPDVPFAWQMNVWATGSNNWVKEYQADIGTIQGKRVADFIRNTCAYAENSDNFCNLPKADLALEKIRPDFLALDRYERDDTYQTNTAWWFNRNAQHNFLLYSKALHQNLNNIAMAWWQIPGGHMLTNNNLADPLPLNHVATFGDFLFGSKDLFKSSDSPKVDNLQAPLANFMEKNPALPAPNTIQESLDHDYQGWTESELNDLVAAGTAAVFWGGGSTTGVFQGASAQASWTDGGWLANRITEYQAHPILLTQALDRSPVQDTIPVPAGITPPTPGGGGSTTVFAWPDQIATYAAGTTVSFNGMTYQCKPWPYSTWCTLLTYKPGTSIGNSAWDLVP